MSVGQQSSGGSSHTLPRHLGGHASSYMSSRIPSSYGTIGMGSAAVPSKSLSDYENEILMLRSEMELNSK